MKRKINIKGCLVALMVISSMLFNSCKDDKEEFNCHEYVQAHPGYEVWAGDSAYYKLENLHEFLYCIDQFGYTKIGSATTTQSFNTGNYKYYVVVAKYNVCIDAIEFFDGSFYHQGDYTIIGGQGGGPNVMGPPDGISGELGPINDCPPPLPDENWPTSFPDGISSSFNGYLTDSETIISRGGGLTVHVGSDCQ